jgi:hypothetical protein
MTESIEEIALKIASCITEEVLDNWEQYLDISDHDVGEMIFQHAESYGCEINSDFFNLISENKSIKDLPLYLEEAIREIRHEQRENKHWGNNAIRYYGLHIHDLI